MIIIMYKIDSMLYDRRIYRGGVFHFSLSASRTAPLRSAVVLLFNLIIKEGGC